MTSYSITVTESQVILNVIELVKIFRKYSKVANDLGCKWSHTVYKNKDMFHSRVISENLRHNVVTEITYIWSAVSAFWLADFFISITVHDDHMIQNRLIWW